MMIGNAPVYVQFIALCVNLTVQVINHFVIRHHILRSVVVFHKVLSGVKDGVVVAPANGDPIMAALPLRDLPNALQVVLSSGEENFGR